MTTADPSEPVLETALPIVDAHHHLWYLPEAALAQMDAQESFYARSLAPTLRRHRRYLFDEFLADLNSGHNIRATVFVDAHAMYRAAGPEALRSAGEVEFVSGCAAMSESGLFGDVKMCAGIVGGVDLRLGDAVDEVLQAHIRAGGGRYRGVRSAAVHDEDASILGADAEMPHLLLDPRFRAGFKRLRQFGLSFDVFIFDPQLPELIDLARAFPETLIVLNHTGCPLGVGRFAHCREDRFAVWRKNIRALSRCANVAVKLGGLGLPFCGFKSLTDTVPVTSSQLATDWRPYVEICIDAFGAERCMFESNFPIDAAMCSYAVVWNAFKRLTAGASKDEKAALFSGTATRVYRLSA